MLTFVGCFLLLSLPPQLPVVLRQYRLQFSARGVEVQMYYTTPCYFGAKTQDTTTVQDNPSQCNNCRCWGCTDPTHVVMVQNAVQGTNNRARLLWESERAKAVSESRAAVRRFPGERETIWNALAFAVTAGHTLDMKWPGKYLHCGLGGLQALGTVSKKKKGSTSSPIFQHFSSLFLLLPSYFSRGFKKTWF